MFMKLIIFGIIFISAINVGARDLPQLTSTPEEAAAIGARSAATNASGIECTVFSDDIYLIDQTRIELRYLVLATCPKFVGDQSGLGVYVTVKAVIDAGQIHYYSAGERISSAPDESLE
jgi:hypothetical protein